MSKERDLGIYTLKAREIIRLIEDRNGVFDLNSGFIRESILEGKPRRYSDNGLTDQIMFVIEDRAGRRMKRGRLASLLTENLVYLDFGRKLPEDSAAFRRLIEEGFSLIFRGKKDPVRFVASEKSASMARDNVISFISADIYDEVDRRLGLDIDWQKIKVIPSKYYAYRGLYLTDGTAVVNDDLVLNEKTVIVLPLGKFGDDFARHEIEILTTDTGGSEDGKIEINDSTTRIKTTPLDPSLYDGEGIVSPAYARLMAGSLETAGDGEPTSFQIRMPFTKGMLHTADFRRFITDQFPDAFFERLTVKDVFGIERRLMDAEIVLTDSMFKCGKWLKAYFADTGTDPMKYFFEKFREFDHALYVCKTDLNLHNTGRVRMNYQFFSTLDMDADTFDAIVARHISDSHLIGSDHGKSVEAVMGKPLNDDAGDDDIYEDGTCPDDEESWGYALRRNAAFVNDPFIRSRIRETEKSRILDVMKGNVLVEGINKYLSGDLLSLLITIARMSGAGDRERIGELYKKTLHSDRFYISDRDSYALRRNYHYGMLRSPHLSRNEQCALRPYADESIYDEYFGRLDGVVMVSNLSYAPVALGGADFDGDTVKIILDRDINKAILKGAYEEYTYTGHDGKERSGYKRKLPVVSITTPDGHWRAVGKHISYEDVRAAFSNDIGKISNLAIDLGSMEYGEGTLAPGTTAMCTIATGLEIDSVKTGRSPGLGYLESLRGGDGEEKPSYYLRVYREFRQKYLDLEWKRGKTVYAEPGTDPEGYRAYLKVMVPDGTYTETVKKGKAEKKANKKEKKEEIFTAEAGREINIDRLPFHYTEDLYENPPKKGRNAMIKMAGAPEHRFTFETDDGWKERAEKDPRREALAEIIRAYYKARRDTVDVSTYRKDKDTLRSTIEALLDIEYDMERDRLLRTGVDVMTALDIAYEELYEALPGFVKAVDALKSMRRVGWQYIRGYDLKREALSEIVDTDRLSESTIELLCDTYDNGYQILNYLLIDTLESRKGRRDGDEDGDGAEEDAVDSEKEKTVLVFNKELYTELLESSRVANENKRSRTRWLRTAGDICRDEVLKLFDSDIESAVACTVLLGAGEDKTHVFLWGVFRPEDLKRVIYTGRTDAGKGGRDA